MKKTKQPGDNISLKTKKSEDPAVMQWINAQTNLMDSLRYLIEHEIVRHGVRNLQTVVPVERNVLGGVQREAEQAQAAAGHGPGDDPPGGERVRWFDGDANQRRAEHNKPQSPTLQQSPIAPQGAMVRQPPDALPGSGRESSEPAEPRTPAEDEIDDEDIDAWT